MSEEGTVQSSVKNGVGRVSFSHPQSNSLPGVLLRKIAAEIRRLGDDTAARVIVLESTGDKAFCAGASFDELLAVRTLQQAQAFFSGFGGILLAIRDVPKFVVARVQGKTAGGGVGIVAAADFALATEGAAVRLSELAVGIGPFTISPAVERKIGTGSFSELAVSAEWRDAAWARACRLYNELHPDIASLDKGLDAITQKLCGYSAPATVRLKRVLWAGTERWEKTLEERVALSSELLLTAEAQSAIASARKS